MKGEKKNKSGGISFPIPHAHANVNFIVFLVFYAKIFFKK
jgi:hypothetical protein